MAFNLEPIEENLTTQEKGLKINLDQSNETISKKQKEILSAFPPLEAYVKSLRDFLIAQALEQKRLGKPPLSESDVYKQVYGKIFENLAQVQMKIDSQNEPQEGNFVPYDQETPEMKSQREFLETQLIDIMQNPEKYNFFHWETVKRVPDLSLMKTRFSKEGKIFLVITALGEAKSGKFDRRMYEQITNFEKTIVNAVMAINQLSNEDAVQHKLAGFGRDGIQIRMLKNLEEIIVVPRDADTEKDAIESMVNAESFGRKSLDYQNFIDILKREQADKYNISFKKSVFAKNDLHKVTDKVIRELWQLLDKDFSGHFNNAIKEHRNNATK